MSDQEISPALVLEIDQQLSRTSIHESLILLQDLQRALPRSSQAHDLCHKIGLRLTHFLLHSHCPDLERNQILSLHRYHAHNLAQALCRSQARDQDLNHVLALAR